MPGGGRGYLFYARSIEKETTGSDSPVGKSTRSSVGWIVCFTGSTAFDSMTVIYKRFSGYRGALINAALGMTGARDALHAESHDAFGKKFIAVSRSKSGRVSRPDEKVRQLVAGYEEDFPEGVKLYLGRHAVWMRGWEWLDGEKMEKMFTLCLELSRLKKKNG